MYTRAKTAPISYPDSRGPGWIKTRSSFISKEFFRAREFFPVTTMKVDAEHVRSYAARSRIGKNVSRSIPMLATSVIGQT